ncbi:MAG: hypothetical protein KJ667_04065, partial [Alphaproteobacteria bacterium]|nr:hypothetical protein [Alphaproteobacteria bacterium]
LCSVKWHSSRLLLAPRSNLVFAIPRRLLTRAQMVLLIPLPGGLRAANITVAIMAPGNLTVPRVYVIAHLKSSAPAMSVAVPVIREML